MTKLSAPKLKLLALSSVLFWVPLLAFCAIANEVREHTPLPGDVAILNYIHSHFSPALSNLFLAATNLGSAAGIVAITILLALGLIYRKWYTKAGILLFSVAGAALANLFIKLLFKRQRPSLWHSIIHEQSFSFPSGHAMASSALAFACVYITWQTRFRWLGLAVAVIFMLWVGLSRLYFGVHYPSDVLGGWLISLAWVTIVVAILKSSRFSKLLMKFVNKPGQ